MLAMLEDEVVSFGAKFSAISEKILISVDYGHADADIDFGRIDAISLISRAEKLHALPHARAQERAV